MALDMITFIFDPDDHGIILNNIQGCNLGHGIFYIQFAGMVGQHDDGNRPGLPATYLLNGFNADAVLAQDAGYDR